MLVVGIVLTFVTRFQTLSEAFLVNPDQRVRVAVPTDAVDTDV